MDRQLETITDLLYDKILLYQELIDKLKEEQGHLLNTNVDALWEVSAKKQELVAAVKRVRGKILLALSDMSIDHGMDVSTFSLSEAMSQISSVHRGVFRKSYLTLVGLKAQTKQLSAQNKIFIEESLAFLDEIMGLIAGSEAPDSCYDGGGTVKAKGHANVLFCREV